MTELNINKIVTSGCSFTFGEELDNPKQEAWPVLVAKNLNSQCENLGWPGAGNEHIANKIIEYCALNENKNTLFIIMWSHFSRQLFCRSENHNYLRHISATWPAEYDKDLKNLLFTKYYNETYLFKKTLIQIILLQNFFKAKNYHYIMCSSMKHIIPDNVHNDLKSLVNQIDKTKYKEFNKFSFDTLTDPDFRAPKGHPDARAHKQIADIITSWIKDEFQIP